MAMLQHPFRILALALAATLGMVVLRLATADRGGVYDPDVRR